MSKCAIFTRIYSASNKCGTRSTTPWLAQHWDLPLEKISRHARQVGNLGSASIWAALDQAITAPGGKRTTVFLGAEATQYAYGGFVLEE